MNSDDYREVLEMTDKLEARRTSNTQIVESGDIESQVTNTLWNFMQTVFRRVDEDYSFKNEVQDELRARMSEMDVGMLMALYNRLNEHEVSGLRTAMAPFMPKEGKGGSGDATTLLDTLKGASENPEQILHDGADADVLRGIQHLNTLLGQMGKDE